MGRVRTKSLAWAATGPGRRPACTYQGTGWHPLWGGRPAAGIEGETWPQACEVATMLQEKEHLRGYRISILGASGEGVSRMQKENPTEGRKALGQNPPALPPLKYLVSVAPCKFRASLGSEEAYSASYLCHHSYFLI